MRTLKIEPFEATITQNTISVEKMSFLPAEGPKITALLGIAGGMRKAKALPPHISDGKFAILFNEDGGLVLNRRDTDKSIDLTFESIDQLIQLVNASVDVFIDIQKLDPPTRPRGFVHQEPPDIIEGR